MKIEYINNKDELIKIPIPESYSDCWVIVKSDYARYRNDNPSFKNIITLLLKDYSFEYLFLLRMAKYRGFFFLLFKYRLVRLGKKLGISFSQNVKIGYSLKLVHAIGIIVNVTAVIGNGVTLHQLTSIGSDKDEAAIIGDNVYIGPNVCLVESVKIGSYSKIGAGAVVVSDIPSRVTAVGVPAKVKK